MVNPLILLPRPFRLFFSSPLSFCRTSLTHFIEQGAVLYQGVNHARLLPIRSSRMLPAETGSSEKKRLKYRSQNFCKKKKRPLVERVRRVWRIGRLSRLWQVVDYFLVQNGTPYLTLPVAGTKETPGPAVQKADGITPPVTGSILDKLPQPRPYPSAPKS